MSTAKAARTTTPLSTSMSMVKAARTTTPPSTSMSTAKAARMTTPPSTSMSMELVAPTVMLMELPAVEVTLLYW